MKNHMKYLLSTAVATAFVCGTLSAQDVKVDYSKYPDATPYPKVGNTFSSTVKKASANGLAKSSRFGEERPDHVNNALTKYFPPVFNQSGGSCGSAQAIGYCLTYELNAYRNLDASLEENQLPTHFTWLHTYCDIDKFDIVRHHGVPNVPTYGGRTYSNTFGLQDTSNPDYGYMQGYDKWYSAMFNRTIGGDIYCDANQTTELGREQLKQYLWNHWGDETFWSGGVSGIGVASGGNWQPIPSTPTNRDIGVAGMKYVASWGETYDHALSVVGYDDRVEFDLDGNGVIGEKDKDEVGAWIICNSWGAGWCNKGFIYCPYKYSYGVGTNKVPMNSGHYTVRKDYVPKRTFKILMDYDHRSEISISAGLSPDTAATSPLKTESMPFFRYAGDGSESEQAPAVPLLGRWKGRLNFDPMEFGYDITDLTSGYDTSKPLKYFLKIDSRSNAVGAGNIYKLSVIDYTYDKEGLEIPARIDTVAILNKGKTTLVSLTVAGQQVNVPLNVSLANKRLTWSEPRRSSFDIARYYVYKGDEKVAEVPAMSHSYIVDDESATYYVSTAYAYRDSRIESAKSNPARNSSPLAPAKTNQVLQLDNATASVSGLLSQGLKQGTIEFLLKPATVKSNNQQVGEAWGSFLFCTNNTGQVMCGWDSNNRLTTKANTLKADKWYHIAISVDGNTLTLFVDGLKKGTLTSNDYSGIPALKNFCIGTANGAFDGQIEELRIWTRPLTQVEIFRNKGLSIANPAAQTDLLAYYPMDTYEAGGQLYLKDYASGYDIALSNASTPTDDSVLSGSLIDPVATFIIPSGTLFAGNPITLNSTAMVNAIEWQWAVNDEDGSTATGVNPSFVFKKAGTYDITHTITDIDGNTVSYTQSVDIENPEPPVADFTIAQTELAAGEMFSLGNQSIGDNCTYTWSLPGADQEEIHAVNTGVTYSQPGVFPITLTATNAGGESKKTLYVTVQQSAPRAQFSVNPSTIMLGQTTYLIDETRQAPETWKWTVTNGRHTYEVNGQNSSLTPTHPGYYDITLEASNAIGTTTVTEEGRLLVLNADSKNGLTFSGGERLESTADLFPEGTKAFTLEWWMLPYQAVGALNMTTKNDQIAISTDIYGEMSLTIGGKTAKSGQDYVLPGTWHHYAITYSFGTVKYYRDGELIANPDVRLGTSTTDWGTLTVSGGDDSYKGQIDELRIWGKSLSLSNLKGYINSPLTDLETLVADKGLVAYYDCNQDGGTLLDRTSNSIDLSRIGFGPDGDAWGLSTGVFSLDLDAASDTEVIEADGITNIYQAVSEGKTQSIVPVTGGIRFAFAEPTPVRIYTLSGQCVFSETVEGVHYIGFLPGIYIANGQKIVVN